MAFATVRPPTPCQLMADPRSSVTLDLQGYAKTQGNLDRYMPVTLTKVSLTMSLPHIDVSIISVIMSMFSFKRVLQLNPRIFAL